MNTGIPSRTAGAIVFGCSHLRAERCELGGFVESDLLDELRSLHHSGVGGQHPIHIGPDLDGVGVERGAEQGCAVIGSAAAESGRNTRGSPADESAHHRYPSLLNQWLHHVPRVLRDRIGLWLRRHEIVVGDKDIAGIDVLRGNFAELEEGGA